MARGYELDYSDKASAMDMAQKIFGPGTTVVGADYQGDKKSSAIYGEGDSLSPRPTPADEGVILSTGRAKDFTRNGKDPNKDPDTTTNTKGVNNDAAMNAAVGTNTYDAAILTVDFIPTSDKLNMQFTFASEEFPEYSNTQFNDAFAVWINGDLVEVPVIRIAQVNQVNQVDNTNLFVGNTGDDHNTEMDGFTVTLAVEMPVEMGVINTLRVAIADTSDSNYDSNVLIAANSIQGVFDARDDAAEVRSGDSATLDLTANDDPTARITHINGQEVSAGDTMVLADGTTVTLRADGDVDVTPPALADGATDPVTSPFTYTVESAGGITDTAFVTVTTIPCFAAGTPIRTPRGEVPVERIGVGDLVETLDCGPVPVRWAGGRTVRAVGRFAPVVIEPGVFGLHGRLRLSPQHRVLVRHTMATLMFGEDEVLVAAKDLVNGVSIWTDEGGEVTYHHLLFDRHQIVWSAGLLTESFLPGPQTLPGFDAGAQAEILALFPDLADRAGVGAVAARPSLRCFEARALFA